MRIHFPSTSFVGYLSRRSPLTSSRTDAPLEQCDPRLIGLSQLGSWLSQTPFCTSAVTVQPTEQCVQMLLRVSTGIPGFGGGPASALRPPLTGSGPIPARAPAVRPERRRNARRSIPPDSPPSAPTQEPRRAAPSPPPISITAPPWAENR